MLSFPDIIGNAELLCVGVSGAGWSGFQGQGGQGFRGRVVRVMMETWPYNLVWCLECLVQSYNAYTGVFSSCCW